MRLTVILALVVGLSTAVMGCASLTSAAVSRQSTTPPAPSATPSAQEIDRSCISAMVLHHTAAVEMAQVEVQRGQRSDVKQLAQPIVGAQESQINELEQITQQDFNFTPLTTLPGGTQQGVLMGEPLLMDFSGDVNHLKSAADPDIMFLQMMIPHHAIAIVQADSQMMYGSNRRLQASSQNIISSQSREIGEMEDLLQHH
jgi:uncharacterized protein (DUF305 family)